MVSILLELVGFALLVFAAWYWLSWGGAAAVAGVICVLTASALDRKPAS